MNLYQYQSGERRVRVIILSIYKLYPSYNLPQHMKGLEMETLYGCPLLCSALDLSGEGFKGLLSIHICVDRNTVLQMLLCKGVAVQGLHIVIKWLTAAPVFLFYSGVQHESWTVNTELLLLAHKC